MGDQIKVFVEDSIMQKDEPVTAGSKILAGFRSPIQATVVKKLEEAGMQIEKRLAMDEFGIDDFFSEDDQILASVREAAADKDVCVLCNDIFGKVRRQAALNGISFIKPTYGTVSRYGLVAAAASMDQIGIACADPKKGFAVLAKIMGEDGSDGAMLGNRAAGKQEKCSCDTIRVAVPDHVWGKDKVDVKRQLEKFFDLCDITLDYFDVYHQVLYILSSAEICNNLNRYDGVKFGYRSANCKNLQDLYFNTRSEGFTLNTKLAIIMGANVLSQENYAPYYEKAMKIRRLIKESIKFASYDVIALPVRMKGKSKYEQSALYALTALAGFPSITVPFGDSGIQFIADTQNEAIFKKIPKIGQKGNRHENL